MTIHSIGSDTGAGLRIRPELVESEPSRHSYELWKASDPNPSASTRSELLQGRAVSLLLAAYFADVTFERLHVRSAG